MVPGIDQQLVINHLYALSVETPVARLETLAISAAGETHWLQWTFKAIFDNQAHLIEFQATGRDVSPQKQNGNGLKRN